MTNDNSHILSTSDILPHICELLLSNGIKATTMDSIAATLHISKRTLYEMFQSKEHMVEDALKFLHSSRKAQHQSLIAGGGNVMECLMKGINMQRQWIARTSVAFFKDLDHMFSKASENANKEKEAFFKDFASYLQLGINEGYIRKDINVDVQCRILILQMESLKRMEANFPPHITLIEAYDSVSLGFVRGIATPRGHEVIEAMRLNSTNRI